MSGRIIGGIVVVLLVGAVWYSHLLFALFKPTIISASQTDHATNSTQENNTLVYSGVGVKAPIVMSPNKDPLILKDWPAISQALREGVVISFSSDVFADASFAYVIGHSSDVYPHQFSSIFAGLGQAKQGDMVSIVVDDKFYTYKVKETLKLKPNDTNAFRAIESGSPSIKRIALVTCWPVLTTKERLVVIAEQVE